MSLARLYCFWFAPFEVVFLAYTGSLIPGIEKKKNIVKGSVALIIKKIDKKNGSTKTIGLLYLNGNNVEK